MTATNASAEVAELDALGQADLVRRGEVTATELVASNTTGAKPFTGSNGSFRFTAGLVPKDVAVQSRV